MTTPSSFAAIPLALRERAQWVLHKGKKPLQASCHAASVNDPKTWGTFEQVRDALGRGFGDGVGFVFTESTGIVFVDFDHVLAPDGGLRNDLDPEVRALAEACAAQTYCEVSPSGTGLHALFAGKLPEGAGHRRGAGEAAVEVWDRARYATVTGNRWGSARFLGTSIAEAPEVLDAIVAFVGTHEVAAAALEPAEPDRLEEIAEALTHLDPDMPRPDWIRVGMALKAGLGEAGRDLFVGWSREGSKHVEGEPDRLWDGFRGAGTGLGTVVWMAEQAGWERDGKYTRPEDVFTVLEPFQAADAEDDGRVAPLSSFAPEDIEWLWTGRIPLGHLTIIAGNPGDGKSIVTLDLAAKLTRGRPLPFEAAGREPATVLLLNAEDGVSDTLRPRFDAMGGDPSRVLVLDVRRGSQFQLPNEVEKLKRLVGRYGPIMVVIDPLNTALSVKIDSHKDQEVRQALAPLMALAQDGRRIAVVLVAHWNKSRDATSPLNRISGSVGIGAAARSVLFVGPPPDGEAEEDVKVIAQAKPQLGRRPASLAFKVVEWEQNPKVGVVEWLGETNVSAARLTEPPPLPARTTSGALAGAVAWLETRLAQGPVPSAALRDEAEAAGISEMTLRRAQVKLNVRARKLGAGGWTWELSAPAGAA